VSRPAAKGDLIVGTHQRSAVATLVERNTRVTILVRLPGEQSAQSVGDSLIATLSSLPAQLRR
jgi:IS30 family transposase